MGILGVCAITELAVRAADGTVTLEPRVGLSLSVDHPVLKGAPAARAVTSFVGATAEIDALVGPFGPSG